MAFLHIITDNVLPLLVFVVIGYLMDRKFSLDVTTLTKLTFYLIIPCFIFYSIYCAKLDMNLLNVFLFCCLQMAIIGVIGYLIGKLRGWDSGKTEAFKNGTMFSNLRSWDSGKTEAFKNGTMFSNNGNIGIAMIALIFTNAPFLVGGAPIYLAEASAVATMTLVQMNLFLNTLGLYQAGKGRLTTRDALRTILHMPVLYTLLAVFAVKIIGFDMTATPLWPIFENCAKALVAIVMMALGMQIHRSKISFSDQEAWLGVFVRLIGGPVICCALILLWDTFGSGFSAVTAQTLLIMSSVPSAVNSVLYAVEFQNHVDFATELVMMSTFAGTVTMTLVIYAARILFPI